MNQNKKAILDLVFYLVIPFLIWKFAKPYIDPYYAMLLSSVPGIIYTLYTFKKEKQFNVTGFFILITLISNTTVDLLSGSAERMLWNDAYYRHMFNFYKKTTYVIFRSRYCSTTRP